MSSQCKGTTKSGSPCKITIVLPNGYCRVHQDQYIVEIKENTKDVETIQSEAKNELIKENILEEKSDKFDTNSNNSTAYVRKSKNNKRLYLVPVLVFAFFWFIVRLVKQKK